MKSLFVLFAAFLVISNTQTTTTLGGSLSGGLMVGGFSPVTDTSESMYLYAMNQVFSQNPGLVSWKLVSAEQQIVSGMNYRFTFKNNKGQTALYLTYVPLNYKTLSLETPLLSSQTSTNSKESSTGNTVGNGFGSTSKTQTSVVGTIPNVSPQIESYQNLRNYY